MVKVIESCGVLLLVAVYLMQFFHVQDPAFLFVLPVAICLAGCLWKQPIRLTHIDLCLLLLWGYGLFAPSVNCIGSLISSIDMAGSLFSYFLMRYIFIQRCKARELLSAILVVCILALSILGVFQFIIFDRRVHEVGFTSLYDFRFLYRPLGVPSNEWNALQWLWGGMIFIAYLLSTGKCIKRICLLSALMVWSTIIFSFSRSGYVAIIFCGTLFVIQSFRNEHLWQHKIFAGACFALIAILLCLHYRAEVEQTFRMDETVSQQRSIAGRSGALQIAKKVIDEYPWGVGKGNYNIAKDYYMRGNIRSDSYTSYAGNVLAKVMVEGGYAGLILYVLLLISVCWWGFRSREHNIWIVYVFLLGFFIKDLTFPTFYDSGIIQLSVMFILAFIQKDNRKRSDSPKLKFEAAIPIIVWLGISAGRLVYKYSDNATAQIGKYISTHSEEALDKALEQSPLDVQLRFYKAVETGDTVRLTILATDYPDKLLFGFTLYEWYKKCGQMNNATYQLSRCILNHPRLLETNCLSELPDTVRNSVVKNLKTSIGIAPDDVMQLAKYGSVAIHLGDTLLAAKYLSYANTLLPNLSRVWGNLATIEKGKGNTATAEVYKRRMCLLEQGVFAKQYEPLPKANINIMLEQDYSFLFLAWYRSNLNK